MSVLFGDVATALQAMAWIFATVAAVGLIISAVVYCISVFGTRGVQRREARLRAHSSVFWSRWSADRLWAAPYDELAAEAGRCEQIIDSLRQRQTLATSRFPTKREKLFLHYLDNQIADSRRSLSMVHSAMHYVAGQTQWPPRPHYPA